MSDPQIKPLVLSSKNKFNTIFSGLGLMSCIALVLGVYTFSGEIESQVTFFILIIVNLVFYGFVIKSFVIGFRAWDKLQKLLPHGALAVAYCVRSKHYSYDDSQNSMKKLTYEFEVNGKKYSFITPSVAKVQLPITVLYDQNNPDTWLHLAMLPDSLADRIQDHYGHQGE